MAKIRTTVIVEITDARGEVFEVKRTLVQNAQDNSRFWAKSTMVEIDAAKATVFGQISHHYGDEPVQAEDEPPYRCRGCGRIEEDCSADPCPAVIKDRNS